MIVIYCINFGSAHQRDKHKMDSSRNQDDATVAATDGITAASVVATAPENDVYLTMNEEKKESTDDVMLFLAKDGMYYNSYMEQRAANIQYNENKLKSIGLGGSYRHATQTSSPPSSRKRAALIRRTPTSNDTAAEPRRKSGRLRQQQSHLQSPQAPEQPVSEQLPLEDDHPDKTLRQTARKLKFRRISSTAGGTSTTASTTMTTNTINIADRQILQKYEESTPLWVQDMEVYLKNVEALSHPNVRSVMRQVDKLVTGVGITYKQWEEQVYFHRDAPVSLSDDMDNLYNEALEFEIEHGRDLGNGWLLRHPIKKLTNYQRYYLQQQQQGNVTELP